MSFEISFLSSVMIASLFILSILVIHADSRMTKKQREKGTIALLMIASFLILVCWI